MKKSNLMGNLASGMRDFRGFKRGANVKNQRRQCSIVAVTKLTAVLIVHKKQFRSEKCWWVSVIMDTSGFSHIPRNFIKALIPQKHKGSNTFSA